MAKNTKAAGEWTEHEVPEIERTSRPTHNFNDNPTVTGIVVSCKRQNVGDPEGGGKKEKTLIVMNVDGEPTTVWLPMPQVYHPMFVKLRGHEAEITRIGDASDPSAVRYNVRSRRVARS